MTLRRALAIWLYKRLTLGDLYCPWCETLLCEGAHFSCIYLEHNLRGKAAALADSRAKNLPR